MKNKLLRLGSLMLALCMAFQLAVFAERPSAQDRADTLTAVGVSAVQYALVKDGQIIEAGASGVYSRLTGEPVEQDTMFGIGSVSKMFTAAIIMMLADSGQIDLDAPVVSYVEEFEMADERYTDITVRMLLNHSSGLAGSTMNDAALWSDSDTSARDTLLSDLKTQRLKADPGAFSVYCNDGFSLAEIVAERVSGMSFAQLVGQWISEPLGLENTKTPLDEFDRASIVRTYSLLDAEKEMPNETLNMIGTGGVYSTASELAIFGNALFTRGALLSDESIDAMAQPEYANGQWLDVEDNILAYGLGWDTVELFPFNRYGIAALCKGGDTVQFHSSLIVLPEFGLSAAVTATGSSSSYCMVLATEMLLDYLLETGEIDEILPPLEITPPTPVQPDFDAAQYEGYYASSTLGYYVGFDEIGTMHITVPAMGGAQAGEFYYIGEGLWRDATGMATMYFLEQEGKHYIVQSAVSDLLGLGQVAATVYFAQRLDDYTPSDEVLQAWNARNYMSYVNVGAKYTSLAYTYSLPAVAAIVDEQNPGYMSAYKLENGNLMVSVVQIPMSGGRDTFDFIISVENGVEYLSYGDMRFMSLAAVPEIWAGPASICTIQPSGDARWYYFGEGTDGKTVTVTCPEMSGFAFYDSNGQALGQSAVTGEYTFVAQAGGYIVFAGEIGTVFNISVE